jgi:hypothetical protein
LRGLLADIAPEPASLAKLDSILASHGAGAAHKHIASLVASQRDTREKVLRPIMRSGSRRIAKAAEVDGQTAAS